MSEDIVIHIPATLAIIVLGFLASIGVLRVMGSILGIIKIKLEREIGRESSDEVP